MYHLPPLIDCHCHANLFAADEWKNVAQRALEKSVRACLSAGVWWDEFSPFLGTHREWIVERCRSGAEFADLFIDSQNFLIFPCIGLHPMEISKRWIDERGDFNKDSAHEDVDAFLRCARQRADFVWAVGETGFDCAKEVVSSWSSKQELLRAQDFAFEASISLALELNRPLIIHSRGAWEQTKNKLDDAHARGLKTFMLHCYSGHSNQLAWLESVGGFASFGGVITWPLAQRMKDALQKVTDGCFMLETDSPDLAPFLPDNTQPKINEPSFLWEILSIASQLRQQESSILIGNNFRNLVHFLFSTPS